MKAKIVKAYTCRDSFGGQHFQRRSVCGNCKQCHIVVAPHSWIITAHPPKASKKEAKKK